VSGERDRRKHPRFDLLTPVTLLVPGASTRLATEPARLEDISEGGCFLTTPRLISARQHLSVSFVARPRMPCWAQGAVVRAVAGRGFGVQFKDVSDSFREIVAILGALPPEQRLELTELFSRAELLLS
jgi:PilZ domain-containing protein